MLVMDALFIGLLIAALLVEGTEDATFGIRAIILFVVAFSAIFYTAMSTLLYRDNPHSRKRRSKGEITTNWAAMFSCTLSVSIVLNLWLIEETAKDSQLVLTSILTLTLLNGLFFAVGKLIASFIAPDGYSP